MTEGIGNYDVSHKDNVHEKEKYNLIPEYADIKNVGSQKQTQIE